MTHAATSQDVDQALELASKATEGPWRWQGAPKGNKDLVCRSEDEQFRGLVVLGNVDPAWTMVGEADFIAASRELVPAMAERINKLVEALEGISDAKGIGWGAVAYRQFRIAEDALADYRGTKE